VHIFYKPVPFLATNTIKLQPLKKTLGMQEIFLEIDQQESASAKIQGIHHLNTPTKDLLAQERRR
jgi:hypothetical protein